MMKSLLVVDDEQAFTLALEISLRNEGFQVQVASSGEEAIALASMQKPDLILLDIMMPGIGGLETLKVFKSHPDYQKIPIILMSGANPLVSKSEYGWSRFLAKPFTIDEVKAIVQEELKSN